MTVTLGDVPEFPLAVLDAFREEAAGHQDPSPAVVRRPLTLNNASRAELVARLYQLVEEFEARDDADGERVNFLALAVREPRG